MRMCRFGSQALLAVGLLLGAASAAWAGEGGDWRDRVVFTASERLRGEFVDWFRPHGGPRGVNRYDFLGSRLRAGVSVTFPHVQLVVQGQDTRFANLPDDAVVMRGGALGPGALYFLHTHDTSQGEPFLKLGFITFRRSGFAATGGRFEYADGLETEPADPTLAFVKRFRVAERLVGPFSYSHVSRSFDGGRLSYDRPGWNVTAMAARPTHGGFEVSANREIDDVGVAGLALTLKRLPHAPPADVRVFYLYYDDRRHAPAKADNRPDPRVDRDPIAIHSVGGHAATVIDVPAGAVDALLWGVVQAGRWGTLDHGAWAAALEGGYQLSRLPWTPWLRVGYDRSSGDDDPTDGRHGTFFQVLPTARLYAQMPFFNLMNTADLFAQLILVPHRRLSVRVDHHWLSLSEARDLWYSGSGATDDGKFGFGYAGLRSDGRRGLAHLVDVSLAVELTKRLSFNTYYGHAFGDGVVRATFAGDEANYGYAELVLSF